VLEDVFASADYRRAMAVVYVRRALAKAFGRAAV
jgi:CO/xanthine dehydrogenase FAD-binding subunit